MHLALSPLNTFGLYFSGLLFNTTQHPDNKTKRLYGVIGVLYSPAHLYLSAYADILGDVLNVYSS